MANNYCESSSKIPFPKDKYDQAQAIVDRVIQEIEQEVKRDRDMSVEDGDDNPAGFGHEVETDGVWIYGEESFDEGRAEQLVKALVEELELDGVFVVSWAYTCSKLRLDEFGGGAFAVQRGRKTVWVDAVQTVRDLAKTAPPEDNAD